MGVAGPKFTALAPVLLAAALAGCAAPPPVPDAAAISTPDAACAALVEAFDDEVARAGTGDGGYARVPGYRTLRVDRLVASHAHEPMDAEKFGALVAAMRALDRDARTVELANLPAEARGRLDARSRSVPDLDSPDGNLAQRVDDCAERVLARDLTAQHARVWLIAAAAVPDDYRDAMRALGLYPVTGFALAAGVRMYEREARDAFAQPAGPPRGTILVYRPPDVNTLSPGSIRTTVASMVDAEPLPPVPRVEGTALDALLAAYAPDYAIDTATNDDRPGRPFRRDDGVPGRRRVVAGRLHAPRVDAIRRRAAAPARLHGLVRAAPAAIRRRPARRPPRRPRLAGDAGPRRRAAPVRHDPSVRLLPPVRADRAPGREARRSRASRKARSSCRRSPSFRSAHACGSTSRRARTTCAASSRSRRAAPRRPGEDRYRFDRESALRTLPLAAGGTASLYGPDGIVAGTERPERYALWISGIESPGAMRQWGRHATAFVGRRHFDDAFLVERYFARAAK